MFGYKNNLRELKGFTNFLLGFPWCSMSFTGEFGFSSLYSTWTMVLFVGGVGLHVSGSPTRIASQTQAVKIVRNQKLLLHPKPSFK